MKTTLLSLVQDVLSAMNSDEVDDIDATEESRQVTRICEEIFYDLQSIRDWGHKKEIIRLEAPIDNTQPTRMRLPVQTLDVYSVRYNKKLANSTIDHFDEIKYVSPEEFLELTLNRDASQANIEQVTDQIQNFTFGIYNDRGPTVYTSFDDEYIWFDAYDSTVDSTLQTSKTIVYALVMRQFTPTNTYVPDIPNKDWALYRNTIVGRAFEEIKQIPNSSAMSTARQLLIRAQKENGQRVDGEYKGVNYGRS